MDGGSGTGTGIARRSGARGAAVHTAAGLQGPIRTHGRLGWVLEAGYGYRVLTGWQHEVEGVVKVLGVGGEGLVQLEHGGGGGVFGVPQLVEGVLWPRRRAARGIR